MINACPRFFVCPNICLHRQGRYDRRLGFYRAQERDRLPPLPITHDDSCLKADVIRMGWFMNLPENIRTKIADSTVRLIAPAIITTMIFSGIAMYLSGDRHYYRLLTGLIAAVAMVPAWYFLGKGRPRTGAGVILFAVSLAVFTGMIFSGGVRAPAYISTIACLTMFMLLYGTRGGLIFAGVMVGAGGLFIWLGRAGLVPEAVPPSDTFYLCIITTYMILQFCFVLIPVRLMNRALVKSDRDRDELRRAVKERQRSQKELESILNKTPDIIYRLDPRGCFTFISEAVRKYDLGPDDFIGKAIIDFVHPEDRETALRKLHERRSGNRGSTDLEVRIRMGIRPQSLETQDRGQWQTFLVSSEGLYFLNPEGEEVFEGTQGIARDVSETKAYESRIMTLAAVIEQAAEDVVLTDPEGIIQYVNPRFETLTGYAKGEVIGKKTSLFKSGRQDLRFYKELWTRVKQGETWNGRMWNRIKDGGLILQDVTITPIVDARERITGFASVRRDITAQEKMEARLKQSRKMEAMGTLAGGIAHDFNNILGAIMGYAELSLQELKEDAPVALYTGQILKAGDRAKDLVRQILLFSRQAKQEKQPVRVSTLAKEVIKLLRATLPADIEITTQFREGAGLVLSDPAQIHQIFMNLCTNAAHAMKEGGGRLTVTIEEMDPGGNCHGVPTALAPGAYMKIQVADTGQGIPLGLREKIFDPFFTTKSREEGTGMGLSVVYGIVESHGGDIHVTSEVGQGTVFTVFLPSVSPRQEDRAVRDVKIQGGHEQLFFVDDEPALVALNKAVLERLGYQVSVFSDGLSAWQAFGREPERFDVVITDKRMPGMSGMDLARNILGLRPEIPVIMCTGFSESITASQAEAIGIRMLLNKPVSSKEMGQAIRNVLDGNGAL